jgi:hypothetical protein
MGKGDRGSPDQGRLTFVLDIVALRNGMLKIALRRRIGDKQCSDVGGKMFQLSSRAKTFQEHVVE